jgi:cytochrome P450
VLAAETMPNDESRVQQPIESGQVPAHVDPGLVVDFDYLNPPGLADHGDIYQAWRTLHQGPDIVWTPRHGGHWILTRGDDIKWAQEAYQIFSHQEITVPRGTGLALPPATVDPPNNTPYRALLNPSFTKRRVEDVHMTKARALTIELVEQLKPRGHCEFVNDFARVMPVSVFLGVIDLPVERRQEFLEWGSGLSREESRSCYQAKIASYLSEVLNERSERPGDDLLSHIAAWRHNRHFKHEAEMIGMAMLVFAGGLDTVAAELSFAMRHLAEHPELQRRLRQAPAIIPRAVEEFLRRHGLSNTARLVLRACERKGARFLPGDMVMVPLALSGMDDRLYKNALEIDFDREATPHNTFGNGPHKCVGMHLARMELRVFLEEWFKRMPDVRLDPESAPISHAGSVEGMSSLKLIWDA